METNVRYEKQGATITADAILARIEREGICPRPRWHFLARDGMVWILGAVSLSIGALAVAGSLFEFRNTWWNAYEATHESFADFFLDALPYVWIVAFGLFVYSAYWSLRATRRGYRYPLVVVISGSLVTTAVLGLVLYELGVGRFVDENMGAYMPLHHSLAARERSLWLQPSAGRVAGIIREVPFSENVFWIESTDGEPYEIFMDLTPHERMNLRPGEQVRIAGMPTTTVGVLEACMVFMQHNDVLQNLFHTEQRGMSESSEREGGERKVLFARTTKCKELRSYARMAPVGR